MTGGRAEIFTIMAEKCLPDTTTRKRNADERDAIQSCDVLAGKGGREDGTEEQREIRKARQ